MGTNILNEQIIFQLIKTVHENVMEQKQKNQKCVSSLNDII